MNRERAAAERENLREILRLNQRGGRTLSIVDLIDAGTISAEMAAFCWLLIGRGASFLTGAVPGGAGKTTLMASLLAFLPPGERIVTVSDRRVIDDALAGALPRPATVMAHEVGAGRWYGYIWGRDAADFFRLISSGLRCVTCLHADTPEQVAATLAPLGVAPADLERVGLQLFMHAGSGFGAVRRRVRSLHCVVGGRLRTLWRWNGLEDRIESVMEPAELCKMLAEAGEGRPDELRTCWARREQCLRRLQSAGVRAFEDVRLAVVREYGEE